MVQQKHLQSICMKNKRLKKFTAIMPVYSGSVVNEVEQAMESLLKQSLLPDEIIIVIDGPISSEVETLLEKYLKYENRITKKVLDKNLGRGVARNFGALEVKTEFIAIMDSDDIARCDRFEKQIKIMRENDIDLLGGAIEEFEKFPGDLGQVRRLPALHENIKSIAPFRTPYNNVTIMFRNELFKKIKGYDDFNFVEDWDFAVRALASGAIFYNMPEVLVDVRINKKRSYNLNYLSEELLLITDLKKKLSTPYHIIFFSCFLRVAKALLPLALLNVIYSKTLRKRI
jgi:glycosyltransferase involved in cell wall biosynthesis